MPILTVLFVSFSGDRAVTSIMMSLIHFNTSTPSTLPYQIPQPLPNGVVSIDVDKDVADGTIANVKLDWDFSINPANLEWEWVNLPLSVFMASKFLANAKIAFEEAKRKAELKRSDTALYVRKNPGHYELDKITDKVVEALTNSDADVQTADLQVNDAKKTVDIAYASVAAMSAKRDALNALTELRKIDYFATR